MQTSPAQPLLRPGPPIAALLWLGLAAGSVGLLSSVRLPVGLLPGGVLACGLGVPAAIGLLTLFVAAIVATFSLRYMRADQRAARFFVTLGLLAGSVLAFLFAGNLIILALAWSISGWLLGDLVGHSADWREARAAARRMRLVFAAGDLALLGGLAILARHAGSVALVDALNAAPSLPAPQAAAAGVLLVIAAAVRCALPPFAGWLLSSMTAPTPVSALMHAGFVNAGGFLLIRFAPVLEAAPGARLVAAALGLFGAVYGVGIMMVRPDVKRSLAGSTVSQMGFMIMSCGLGAYGAALWHIIAHGLFKAGLFLGSGSAIGMKADAAPGRVSGRTALAIAAGTLVAAGAIVRTGQGDASLVPLLLGIATAMTALVACLGGVLALRARATLLAALGVLVLFHAAGLELARIAAGPDAPPLVPGWALLTLLGAFLGAWVWQQSRLARGAALPLPLYVRLINAGALPATGKGDDQ